MPCSGPVDHLLKRVHMLKHYGVKPWVVLDGRRTPMKVRVPRLSVVLMQPPRGQRGVRLSPPDHKLRYSDKYGGDATTISHSLCLACSIFEVVVAVGARFHM